MVWERRFTFWMSEEATPADITKFALNLRFIYTRMYLKRQGSRLQREQHESDLNCMIEDSLGLQCAFPNLKEEATAVQRKLILYPPSGYSEGVMKDFQDSLKEIFGSLDVENNG